jgi:hypothetical protein
MDPAMLAGEPVEIAHWNKQVLNWQRSNPVVVFSKVSRCLPYFLLITDQHGDFLPVSDLRDVGVETKHLLRYSKRAKMVLGEYAMLKSPVIIEVDTRRESALAHTYYTDTSTASGRQCHQRPTHSSDGT